MGGLWGACPHCGSLLQGWIEVAWPLRIEILLGLLDFTHVELRRGHDAAVVYIAHSAGASSSITYSEGYFAVRRCTAGTF